MRSYPWSRIEQTVEVDVTALIQGSHRIGRHCRIGAGATLKWGATLTAYTEIGPDAFLGPYSVCLGPGSKERPTTIGEGAWLGAHVLVDPGVVIAPGVVVGAGTYVKCDITEPGTYVQGEGAGLRRLR